MDRNTQTLLNSHMNDALEQFLADNPADLETVLSGLSDAQSDAAEIHQNWASSQELI